jgi:hypothetical protein
VPDDVQHHLGFWKKKNRKTESNGNTRMRLDPVELFRQADKHGKG